MGEESDLTSEELELVTNLAEISKKQNLYGTERGLFNKLHRK